MKFIITEEELNNLISYLTTRPYAEVAEGIEALKKLERLEEPKEK